MASTLFFYFLTFPILFLLYTLISIYAILMHFFTQLPDNKIIQTLKKNPNEFMNQFHNNPVYTGDGKIIDPLHLVKKNELSILRRDLSD